MSGAWNEWGLSEGPAVALLVRLGYALAPPGSLDGERDSLREVVLTGRLRAALRRLNPWLSDDNLQKAVRRLSSVQATTLIEANERLYHDLFSGFSLDQDLGTGKKGRQVRVFDFDDPRQNDLLVARQFTVKGGKATIIADLVLFINGIPLAVIECKSPTRGDEWRGEAIDQLARYQELGDKYRDCGAPRLFHSAQLLIATCGQAACYGTVGTPARFYLDWKDPHPRSLAQVATLADRDPPNPQDIALCGLCAPENLLDIAHNFVVFEVDENSHRVIKKIPRYQQFIAVNRAIDRARGGAAAGRGPEERGGVVWHTQGSGKSLTMLWLAQKLRRDPRHGNPTLVLVTDRRDLDRQISNNFIACGYPNPVQADSVRSLRTILSGPGGSTVMTTVQKFQEAGGIVTGGRRARKPEHPVLTDASNVFVLTDEAHRTQYGSLAANLRRALPNAVFFAFTGTPIDKGDRSTLSTFGPYIDRYTIEQAVADGATLPILYESRMVDLHVQGRSLDAIFDRVFADRSDAERQAIKKKYGTERAIMEAPRRIEAIALDVIEHYNKGIAPNGFKAQLVASSRYAAALYKQTLDALHGPPSAVIMSSTNADDAILRACKTTEEERKALIARFLDRDNPLQILIVCDMLITGFDAPVEQVMYLDSPLKEHTLLQAIARVNRTADEKQWGLVVDYCGVSENLQEALSIFAPGDVAGALHPKHDELPRLQARHAAAMRFFARIPIHDRDNVEACVAVLAAEDVRAEFRTAFRRFAESMDLLLPDVRALDYVADLRWLGKIREIAAARYRDPNAGPDVRDASEKVRKLIDEAIIADGVQILIERVSLFSADFEKKLGALKSDEARASEIEHAIRHEIHVKLDEDPAFYQSLREQLEQIIQDAKQRRIDAAQQLSLLQKLTDTLRGRAKIASEHGLSDSGFAIYGLLNGVGLADGKVPTDEHGGDRVRDVAQAISLALQPHTALLDWRDKGEVQREMRRTIKRLLPPEVFAKDSHERIAEAIVNLLKAQRRA